MTTLVKSTCKSPARTSFGAMHFAGIGMIEVLVTLFILSIGLLGVASLQFVGSFSNADALNRSQAVIVAQQFSERLRASSQISPSGNGRILTNEYFDTNLFNFKNLTCGSTKSSHACFCLSHPAAVPNCQTGECTAANFAAYDAYEVSCAATATNPAVKVSLTCLKDNKPLDNDSCSAGSVHRIRLAWPTEDWQGISRKLNSNCNDSGSSEKMDCILLDVTL